MGNGRTISDMNYEHPYDSSELLTWSRVRGSAYPLPDTFYQLCHLTCTEPVRCLSLTCYPHRSTGYEDGQNSKKKIAREYLSKTIVVCLSKNKVKFVNKLICNSNRVETLHTVKDKFE